MLGAKLGVSDYLKRVCQEIQRMDPAEVENLSELIEAAYDEGRFVFICGNGGSGANASHFCEDLAKCTLRDFESQKRLKVLSLTDNTAGIMAWANDESYERIFIEQLKNQDPLSPLQPDQLTAQLAQFSSLEQLTGINTRLDTLTGATKQTTSSALLGLLGKQVQVDDGTLDRKAHV